MLTLPAVIDLTPQTPVTPPAANPPPGGGVAEHVDAPFRFDVTGRVVTVEQDSAADVAACVTRIMCCPRGAKPGDPNFGIPWPLFQTVPIHTAQILAAVQAIEPRADLTLTEVADAFDASIRFMTAQVGVNAPGT